MKKKFIKALALGFLVFGLVGCGNDGPEIIDPDPTVDDTPNDDKPNDDKPSTDEEDPEETPEPEEEKFEIQLKDNGLTVGQELFEFSSGNKEETYVPSFEITINTDNSWNLVTGIYKDRVELKAEDEKVVPKEALSYSIVKNSDLVGASGSNEIEQFKIRIDRSLISSGETKIKFVVQPSNGSSSVSKLTTICFGVKVHEYGTMPIETCNLNFTLDLTEFYEILPQIVDPKSATFSLTDNDDELFYGYDYDARYNFEIPFDVHLNEIKIENLKVAKDHSYNVQIFVEAEETENRTWFYMDRDRGNSDYEIEVEGRSSTLIVYDDATVEAKIGDHYSLKDIRGY